MEGVEGVVHAAAHMYGGTSIREVREINVVGTKRLLDGAVLAGVEQVVHISSVAVYGNPPGAVHEEVPLTGPLRKRDFYGRTKREAELLAREFHGRGGLGITILRPPALYGERDRFLTPRMVALVRRRVVPLLGSGRTNLAVVYAGNVAQAVERALEGKGVGQSFNVTEDAPTTQRGFLEGLAREVGLTPTVVPIPAWAIRAAGKTAWAWGGGVPGSNELSFARMARLATEDNPYPAKKAFEVLGWKPPFSLAEALARTGQWLREREEVHGSR